MEEGRQIEAGHGATSSDKVVRLPRDWLGPREHLVPFTTATPPTVESEPAEFAPNDFWGERSAAIHDVVEGPEPPPSSDPPTRRRGPARLGRRSLAAACLAGAAAAVAIVLLSTGSAPHSAGGTRLDIAAIVHSSVRRIAQIHPPRVVARPAPPRTVKHVAHDAARRKRAPAPPQHHTSFPPATTYVARSTPPPVHPTYHPTVSTPAPHVYTSPRPAASTASSGAKVSPTGQTGALGPVQSPNG